jgi:hypothetical protein
MVAAVKDQLRAGLTAPVIKWEDKGEKGTERWGGGRRRGALMEAFGWMKGKNPNGGIQNS